MPLQKLKEYLDKNGIRYVTISHSKAYTAQTIAASAHIPGQELAKTVIVKVDGCLAMAVLPASYKVDFNMLKDVTGAKKVELAKEEEFEDIFPNCEVGAMPPFGNLWNMRVFVAQSLAGDTTISFNAGSHTELIRMAFSDYVKLVNPQVMKYSVH